MDVISIKVDLVIELIDGFTGERKLRGTVFARTNENVFAMKKDGCLVFFNRPPGKYKITVGGSCYQARELEAEFNGSAKTVTVVLMPSRSYRFPCAATKLYGKAECPAVICFPYTAEQARILGEFKRGETKITAFFSDNDPIRAERGYSLAKAEKTAIYALKHISGAEYELDRPLEFDIDFDSTIGAAYEITPLDQGEYFLAVSGSFKTAEIIVNDRHQTIELTGENTEYDIIKKTYHL